jgi:hypothetical protein
MLQIGWRRAEFAGLSQCFIQIARDQIALHWDEAKERKAVTGWTTDLH